MSETTKDQNRQKFHAVLDAETDSHLQQIIQIHGPFETDGFYVNTTTDICLACNVAWPCVTAQLFQDRYTN